MYQLMKVTQGQGQIVKKGKVEGQENQRYQVIERVQQPLEDMLIPEKHRILGRSCVAEMSSALMSQLHDFMLPVCTERTSLSVHNKYTSL